MQTRRSLGQACMNPLRLVVVAVEGGRPTRRALVAPVAAYGAKTAPDQGLLSGAGRLTYGAKTAPGQRLRLLR